MKKHHQLSPGRERIGPRIAAVLEKESDRRIKLAGLNNDAPWAWKVAATRDEAVREEASKLFGKSERAELQSHEDKFCQLVDEEALYCNEERIKQEIAQIFDDSTLSTDEVIKRRMDLEKKLELIPKVRDRIRSEKDKMSRLMMPAATELYLNTLDRVRLEIEELQKQSRNVFWGIEIAACDQGLLLAIQKLESVLEGEIEELVTRTQQNLHYVRKILITGRVIGAKAPVIPLAG